MTSNSELILLVQQCKLWDCEKVMKELQRRIPDLKEENRWSAFNALAQANYYLGQGRKGVDALSRTLFLRSANGQLLSSRTTLMLAIYYSYENPLLASQYLDEVVEDLGNQITEETWQCLIHFTNASILSTSPDSLRALDVIARAENTSCKDNMGSFPTFLSFTNLKVETLLLQGKFGEAKKCAKWAIIEYLQKNFVPSSPIPPLTTLDVGNTSVELLQAYMWYSLSTSSLSKAIDILDDLRQLSAKFLPGHREIEAGFVLHQIRHILQFLKMDSGMAPHSQDGLKHKWKSADLQHFAYKYLGVRLGWKLSPPFSIQEALTLAKPSLFREVRRLINTVKSKLEQDGDISLLPYFQDLQHKQMYLNTTTCLCFTFPTFFVSSTLSVNVRDCLE